MTRTLNRGVVPSDPKHRSRMSQIPLLLVGTLSYLLHKRKNRRTKIMRTTACRKFDSGKSGTQVIMTKDGGVSTGTSRGRVTDLDTT